jgi:hypothetical protein
MGEMAPGDRREPYTDYFVPEDDPPDAQQWQASDDRAIDAVELELPDQVHGF